MPDDDSPLGLACRKAAAARASGEMRAAAAAYLEAVGLLPERGAEAEAYDLRLARAECLHAAGDYAAELDEVRALLELAGRLDAPALRLTAHLREAVVRGLLGDAPAGEGLAAAALAEAAALGDTALQAEALVVLADLSYNLSRLDEADGHIDAALALARGRGDARLEARLLRLRGLVALSRGVPELALEQIYASLEICRAAGDRPGEALALNAIGIASQDFAQARSAYLQAFAIVEALGERESGAIIANNLGIVYVSLGLYGQAQKYAARAVAEARAIGAVQLLATCLETLGRALLGLGHVAQARAAMQEAQAVAAAAGGRFVAALCSLSLARMDLLEREPARALGLLAEAADAFSAIGAPAERAVALALMAAAELDQGDAAAAEAHSAEAAANLAQGYVSTEFPAQEIWWLRHRALRAYEGPASPAARQALDEAWAALAAGMASVSDPGLRRSYMGRVPLNRAILEALAAEGRAGPPPADGRAGLQDQLARLLAVSAHMNETHDDAALREMLLDELAELTGAERILVVFGADPARPERALGRGAPPADLEALRGRALPHLGEAVRRRRGLLLGRVDLPPGEGGCPLGPPSALAVPLISGARLLGTIYAEVGARLGVFTEGDLELTGLLAAQAATALENARLYEQTRRDKDELERLVAARTADLRAANSALELQTAEAQAARAEAEAASAAKSIFLANVSHELRTPLNAVIGFAQLLSRDQGLGEQQRDLARMIDRSGSHLLGLINDVIELSRVEAGLLTISPAPFDLRGLAEDVETLFRLPAERKGLRLEAHLDPSAPRFIVGDEGRLRQVLVNLVGNALKFTSEGAVRLEIAARPAGPHVRLAFTVVDTGVGIAPDELAGLFLPFAQATGGRNAREGSGLGLALCRQIARLMGGDIRATSRPGVGSAFVCEVLVDAAAGPPSRAPERSQVAPPPREAPPLRRDDLAALDAAVRQGLALAAADSDPSAVDEAVAAVRAGWPELGERLAALAAEFQFEVIEALARDDAE